MVKRRRQGREYAASSASAEIIGCRIELLEDILLRLPAKTLLRFKCVSKHWLKVISDTQFSSTHTRRNPSFLTSALFTNYGELLTYLHPGLQSHPKPDLLYNIEGACRYLIKIVDSCNGLLLCGYRSHYIVCNPTTKNYRVLPVNNCVENNCAANMRFISCLAFDPSKSLHYTVAIGKISCYQNSGICEIDLYHSESSSWDQRLNLDVPVAWGQVYEVNAFWIGAIHWITARGYHLWFDLKLKKLQGVRGSVYPKILREYDIRYFGECDGHLFLIQTKKHHALGFLVHEMDMDRHCWVIKYRISIRGLMSEFPCLDDRFRFYGFQAVSIVKETKRGNLSLVLCIPGKLISFNIWRKTWKVLGELPDQDYLLSTHYGRVYAYRFIESLAPV